MQQWRPNRAQMNKYIKLRQQKDREFIFSGKLYLSKLCLLNTNSFYDWGVFKFQKKQNNMFMCKR